MGRRPRLIAIVVFAVSMMGLSSAVTASSRPAGADPVEEPISGAITVSWTFSGEPEETVSIECSSASGSCSDLARAAFAVDEREPGDCEVDEPSTGTARFVGDYGATPVDGALDRAIDCDRWLWDGLLAATLPLPPHLVIPEVPSELEGHLIGALTVDGVPVEETAPLRARIDPLKTFWMDACDLRLLGSVRIDDQDRWERARGPDTEVNCDEGEVGRGSVALSALFEMKHIDVDLTPTSFSLAARTPEGNVELRFTPIPLNNEKPKIVNYSYDQSSYVVRWTATDDGEADLWACVYQDGHPSQCETSVGSMTFEPPAGADEHDDDARIYLVVQDEYGAAPIVELWAPALASVASDGSSAGEANGSFLVGFAVLIGLIIAGGVLQFVRGGGADTYDGTH